MRDLVPLGIRLWVLSAVRALVASAALVTAWAAPVHPDTPLNVLLLASCAYGLLAAALEGWRRLAGTLPLPVVGASLLADGLYLVGVVTVTGGPVGPLAFLIPVHLIAVTLLASYRTGLKLAVWYSLLLAVAYYLQQDGLVAGPAVAAAATVTAVLAFWVVALVTAACSALNERELRRGRAGFSALATMARRLHDIDHADEVTLELLQAVRDYTGYQRVAVLLYPEAGRVVGRHVDGASHSWVALDPVEPTGAIRRCWDAGRPLLVKSLEREGDGPLPELLPGARNVVVVPLFTDDAPLGVLAVERGGRRGARIPASVVTLLGQFAAHAALAYHKTRLLQEVRRLAAADGLTGLPNRRVFDDALAREVQRARRTEQPLTLLLLDIDHFKQVNDTHGHQVGDEVLRHVARSLEAVLRGSDLPARYGGEEFAVLLPACDDVDAADIAERLRAGIAGCDGPVPVTVSVGLASFPDCASDEAGLVEAADAALYRAKAAGRDRVTRATRHADTA